MPGIVGLITRMPRERAEEKVAAMAGALRHESFYVTGAWSDEQLGVYCGWVARDGSFSARMPLCDPHGETVLVFSGEDYSGDACSGGHTSFQSDKSRMAPGIYSNGTETNARFRQV